MQRGVLSCLRSTRVNYDITRHKINIHGAKSAKRGRAAICIYFARFHRAEGPKITYHPGSCSPSCVFLTPGDAKKEEKLLFRGKRSRCVLPFEPPEWFRKTACTLSFSLYIYRGSICRGFSTEKAAAGELVTALVLLSESAELPAGFAAVN